MGPTDPNVQRDARRAGGAGNMARGLWGHAGRDGSDRRVLEDRLSGARGSLRVLAPQRPPPAQRPRAQDRRQGLRMDLPARPARTRAPELRAAAGNPPAARPDPAARGPDQRTRALDPAAREGPPRRRHQTLQRRLAHVLEVRARDARRPAGAASATPSNSPSSRNPDAPEDPAAARGARQPLPDRAPRR